MSSRYRLKELQTLFTKALLPLVPNAPKEAQLLLMDHLGCDALYLLLHQEEEIELNTTLLQKLKRRMENEPLEYITQKVSFYAEEFYIDPGALIPRPETELLIDEVKKRVLVDTTFTFCEVGIGSGIISIILAKHFPNATFIATDISEKALDVARKNIEKHHLKGKIKLYHTSLLDGVEENIDYLVSNPPYIKNGFVVESNLSYEPQNALFGGEEGSELIFALLDETLKRGINFFSCEIGYDQKDTITKYLQNKSYKELSFYKDYSGFDRGFTLQL